MTKAFPSGVLAGLLASLALASPVQAEAAKTPRPYVVLVGISHYQDKTIKPRPHAEADAKALYDLFTNKDYYQANPKNVHLLLGGEDETRHAQKATRANILKVLKTISAEDRVDDPVIFAFIGEGGPLGDTGDRRCYFTADSTFKGRDKDALAAADLGEAIKDLKSHRFCTSSTWISRATREPQPATPTSRSAKIPTRN